MKGEYGNEKDCERVSVRGGVGGALGNWYNIARLAVHLKNENV